MSSGAHRGDGSWVANATRQPHLRALQLFAPTEISDTSISQLFQAEPARITITNESQQKDGDDRRRRLQIAIRADVSRDGSVDEDDVNIVVANWAQGCIIQVQPPRL